MKQFPFSVWLYALVIALITSLPYIVGAISTPEGWIYSGAPTVPDGAKVDYHSHIAKMWQGARGQYDYQLLFTHEDHAGLPTVQGFYVFLGTISAILSADFALTYHIARFLLTVFMVLAIWSFASRYLREISAKRAVLFFATLVFGWSWILFFLTPEVVNLPERAPIELWLLDAYNLLGAFVMPHFAAAVILQIVAFLIFDAWIRQPQQRYIAILTIVLFVDAIIQPYVVLMTMPIFGFVTAYHIWIRKTITLKQALWLVIPAISHGGIVIFQYVMIAGDPIWADFSAQNSTQSPPPHYYILGYLLLLIPILIGWRHIHGALREDDGWLLPIVWILVVIILLYAPFPTQRRYLLGVQTPLALLAGLGWYRVVLVRIAESWRPFANIPYVTAGALAFALLIFANTMGLANPMTATGVFYSAGEVEAGEWVTENMSQDSLILTTFDWDTTGNGGKVVALTGRRVYLGHWIETADFDTKRNLLGQFYDVGTDDEWRREFISSVGIDLIWYDETVTEFVEKMDIVGWNPSDAEFLEAIFESDSVTLYRFAEGE